ncbi:MAG: S-layer homology domain-containing protein [Clostridiales Family XIII bacterium]|jgi:hypothetical protein|nr:S-layer homology domain-containing protein [Clostridiales Family XIII bacterium]
MQITMQKNIRFLTFLLALALIFAALAPMPGTPVFADTPSGFAAVRIEANGMGIRGDETGIRTVLPERQVDLAGLTPLGDAAAVTAQQVIDKALADAGLGAVEFENSYSFVTVGGISMPRAGHYWGFYLNDASAQEGISTAEIAEGDRIVLSLTAYGGDYGEGTYYEQPQYAYFKTADLRYDNSGYPFASVRFVLYGADWSGPAPLANTVVAYGTESWESGVTDSGGSVSFDLYPTAAGAGVSRFDFYSDDPRISRPYCRISVTTDASGAITALSSSQPVGRDVSLQALDLTFPGMESKSGLSSLGDSPMTVGDVTGVTVSAIAADAPAVVTLDYTQASGGTPVHAGGSRTVPETWLPLSEGENRLDLTVQNGADSQSYRLILKKTLGGTDADAAAASAKTVIDSILAHSEEMKTSYFLSDWILGVRAVPASAPEAAKTAFLTSVLNAMPALPGPMAKTAVALSSLGIDARAIPDVAHKPDGAVDLPARVAAAAPGSLNAVSDAPYMLSLYDLGCYDFSQAAASRADLIGLILNAQNPDGSFGTTGPLDDTSMILPALAPYYNAGGADGVNGVPQELCDRLTAAVDKALAWVSGQQLADGGFDGTFGRNSNTTSVVIIGLSALDLDARTDPRFVKNGRSLIDHLLTFRTADHRLGYQDGGSYNDYASAQGLQALALWENVIESKNGNLYHFSAQVAPYGEWPDADLLTGVLLTPPAKTEYLLGESLDHGGMKLVAEYNSDPANRKEIPLGDCVVRVLDPAATSDGSAAGAFAKTGAVTFQVSYQSVHTASFVVAVRDASGGGAGNLKYVRLSVTGEKGQVIASGTNLIIEPGVTSVLDVLKTVLNSAGKSLTLRGGEYVASIDGLGEFDKGANSGWLYFVDGVDPPESSQRYKLLGGENISWRYTLDYTQEPGASGGSANAEKPAEGAVSASLDIEAKTGADGVAAAIVSADDIAKALSGLDAISKSSPGAEKILTLHIRTDDGATALETTLPKAALGKIAAGADRLALRTAFGDVYMPGATLQSVNAKISGDLAVLISGGRAKAGELSAAAAALVADRPVGAFALKSGGTALQGFGAPVQIRIPYTPAPGETPGALLVCALADGKAVPIPYSVYDEEAGALIFLTDGPLSFAVAHKPNPFADTEGHWAADYISFLSARDAVNGIGDSRFAPQSPVLRAQWVQLLFNLSGAPAGGAGAADFSDVPAGAWYADALAWGSGENLILGDAADGAGGSAPRFRPDDPVSREEIAVILARYMENTAKWTPAAQSAGSMPVEAQAFGDSGSIAPYAAPAVEKMQAWGILNGSSNPDGSYSFRAKESATRAEAAKMLAVMLQSSIW